MNPSALIAALETSKALREQYEAERGLLLDRINDDVELAEATKRLLLAMHGATCCAKRTIDCRELDPKYIDKLQPLASSYGFTLSLSPTGSSVIITTN